MPSTGRILHLPDDLIDVEELYGFFLPPSPPRIAFRFIAIIEVFLQIRKHVIVFFLLGLCIFLFLHLRIGTGIEVVIVRIRIVAVDVDSSPAHLLASSPDHVRFEHRIVFQLVGRECRRVSHIEPRFLRRLSVEVFLPVRRPRVVLGRTFRAGGVVGHLGIVVYGDWGLIFEIMLIQDARIRKPMSIWSI